MGGIYISKTFLVKLAVPSLQYLYDLIGFTQYTSEVDSPCNVLFMCYIFSLLLPLV